MLKKLLVFLFSLSILLTGICHQASLIKTSYAKSISQMTNGNETISHSQNQMNCCFMNLGQVTVELFFQESKDHLVESPISALPRILTSLYSSQNFNWEHNYRRLSTNEAFSGDSVALVGTIVKRE